MAETNDKSSTFVLENFCTAQNTLDYISDRLNVSVSGPLKLKKTNFKYGNTKANKSIQIAKPNLSTNLLTPKEKNQLNKELKNIYSKLSQL